MTNYYRPPTFSLFPPAVKYLLIINALFFLAMKALMLQGVDLSEILGLHYYKAASFKPFQVVTYMFMHGSFMHIFSNMFGLWMFGNALENYWGSKRFLIFYFVCGLGAALTQEISQYIYFQHIQNAIEIYSKMPNEPDFQYLMGKYFSEIPDIDNIRVTLGTSTDYLMGKLSVLMSVPTVGASGAIFGILLAFGVIFPDTLLFLLFLPIPIKAKYFVFFYAAFELYSGIANHTGDDVAHFAHLGGLLFGLIMVLYWKRKRTL